MMKRVEGMKNPICPRQTCRVGGDGVANGYRVHLQGTKGATGRRPCNNMAISRGICTSAAAATVSHQQ